MERLPFNHNERDVLKAVGLSKDDLPSSNEEFDEVIERVEEGGKPLRLAAFYIAFAVKFFFEKHAGKSPFIFFFYTSLRANLDSFSKLVELVEDGLMVTFDAIKNDKSDVPLSSVCRLILADSSLRFKEGTKSFYDYLFKDILENINIEGIPHA